MLDDEAAAITLRSMARSKRSAKSPPVSSGSELTRRPTAMHASVKAPRRSRWVIVPAVAVCARRPMLLHTADQDRARRLAQAR